MALTILPNNGQSLNVTRDPIRNNFVRINGDFLVNHGEYGAALAGQHCMMMIPSTTVNPGIAIPAALDDQIILYAKDGTGLVPETELWLRRESALGVDVCMTEYKVVMANKYWTMIPSGACIIAGSTQSSDAAPFAAWPAAGTNDLIFGVAGGPQFFNNLWSCTATVNANWATHIGTGCYVTLEFSGNFGLRGRVYDHTGTEVPAAEFNYIAIGLKA